MLIGELSDAVISSAIGFRITARNVILESKAMDSGVRIKLYVTHPAIMYYFIRFGVVGTRHHIMGKTTLYVIFIKHYFSQNKNRIVECVRLHIWR